MSFILLLLLSTLSIAGSAAFFSIYGLARVFSGSFISTIIMGSSLESGKLIAASFLYRYWTKITKTMKGCLLAFIFILMIITSMGIFGFLSNSYQDNILPYEQHNQQISLLENEKTEAEQLKIERLARQEEINKQIANLPNNMVNGRRRLIDANKDELAQINKDIIQYTNDIRDHTIQISKLKNQTIQETAHVGPIIFIAKVFGLDVDAATKWLILLIIFAFDPLAVTLTIATNIAILDYKIKKKETKIVTENTIKIDHIKEPTEHIDNTTEPTITTEVISPISVNFNQPEPPNNVKKAFDVFTRTDLSPQENRMKEELESLLKRHQEVLDLNQARSKS